MFAPARLFLIGVFINCVHPHWRWEGISTKLLFVLSYLYVNTILTKGKPGLYWEVGGDLPLREVVVLVVAESRTFFFVRINCKIIAREMVVNYGSL